MNLYQNMYRVDSLRRPGRDYALPGRYFITLCLEGRVWWFGEVREGIMGLNEVGCVVADCVQDIPSHFPHTRLDRWIIMPNHVHFILIIDRYPEWSIRSIAGVETCESHVSTSSELHVSRLREMCKNTVRSRIRSHIPRPTPGSLGSIIGQFKSTSTKRIRSLGYIDFKWQPNYYDKIIRSEKMLYDVRNYIVRNPANWHYDRNNP